MLTARDLMTEDVLSIVSEVSAAEAIALMQIENVRSLIIEQQNQPNTFGILTEQDIVYKIVAPGVEAETIAVRDIMRAPCVPVHPDETIQEVAILFSDTGIQRAPVIQGEELLGVISATDIIMKLEVGLQQPVDILSRRLQNAILHRRFLMNPKEQMQQGTDISRDRHEKIDTQINEEDNL